MEIYRLEFEYLLSFWQFYKAILPCLLYDAKKKGFLGIYFFNSMMDKKDATTYLFDIFQALTEKSGFFLYKNVTGMFLLNMYRKFLIEAEVPV